jgi:transcriptional regulator with XRE-family HTH domain
MPPDTKVKASQGAKAFARASAPKAAQKQPSNSGPGTTGAEHPSTLAPEPETAGLAMRLQELIRLRGTTARTLSMASGLGPDAIRNVFRGRAKSPRGETLIALARALRVPVEVLADPTLPIPAAPTGDEPGIVLAKDPAGQPWGVPASVFGTTAALPEETLVIHIVRRDEEILPDLRAGDRVFVDTRQRSLGTTGKALLRVADGETTLVRYYQVLSGGGGYVIQRAGMQEQVPATSLEVVGRAIGRWTPL